MTPFFGVNSLCEIDILFWSQSIWCHCDTKNSVTVTPNWVLLLHYIWCHTDTIFGATDTLLMMSH